MMTVLKHINAIAMLTLSLTLGAYAEEAPKSTSPLISYTSTQDATGDVKAVYDEIQAAYGVVPEPIKALSLNPAILRNQWEAFKIMGANTNFSPKMGAMMRMLVAEKHDCVYCVGFNKGMLLNAFKLPEEEVLALQKDPSTAKLDEKQKAMLLFMLKSVSTPQDVNKVDIDTLKKLGWSEADMMEGVREATGMAAMAQFIDTFKIQ